MSRASKRRRAAVEKGREQPAAYRAPRLYVPQDGLLSDQSNWQADMRMIARFPVPDALRPALATILAQILIDDKNSARDRVAAAKALTALDKLNMEQTDRVRGHMPSVNVTLNIAAIRQQLIDDNARLGYLGDDTAGDGESGAVRTDGQ